MLSTITAVIIVAIVAFFLGWLIGAWRVSREYEELLDLYVAGEDIIDEQFGVRL